MKPDPFTGLLPCPFCGGTNLDEWSTGVVRYRGGEQQTCWIDCCDCGASGPQLTLKNDDYQRVRDAWNNRASK